MEDKLIEYSTAKLAKEKGFVVEKYPYYTSPDSIITHSITKCLIPHYYAATQSLLQKWLREKHHLIIIIAYQYEYDSTPYSYWIYKENNSLPINQWVNDLNTYEEALEIGLQEALKLI